jgi:hypothetical protein
VTDQSTPPTTEIPQSPRPSAVLAPAPTARTIRRRTSLPVQLYRFVAVNLRMAKMVRRSHQS